MGNTSRKIILKCIRVYMYLNLPIKCMIIEHSDMSESERTNINGKKQYYPEYACTRTKYIVKSSKMQDKYLACTPNEGSIVLCCLVRDLFSFIRRNIHFGSNFLITKRLDGSVSYDSRRMHMINMCYSVIDDESK